MKISWYGTAAVKIETDTTKILFDPFIRPNRKLPAITAEDFCGADAILLTHGHFDHILSIPEILSKDRTVPVYCTFTPFKTLTSKLKVPAAGLNVIRAGDRFSVGDIDITVYRGSHIPFNLGYMLKVFPQCALNFPRFFKLGISINTMPENNETVIYKIENGGKTVMLMGSFGTAAGEDYPESPDMFVFPYSGNTGIEPMSKDTLERLKPKSIMFSHFDNFFPPLTMRMDVEDFCRILSYRFPSVKLIVPQERKTYDI